MRPFLVAPSVILLVSSPLQAAKTIDGDPSDWTGSPPPTIHSYAADTAALEWIYTGETGDQRTDPSGDGGNYDLTEVRVAADADYLYFLIRYADISAINEVHLCLGFDLDQSASDSNGHGFHGDDAGLAFSAAEHHPEYLVSVHNAGDPATEVEFLHDAGLGGWYNNDEIANSAWISADNDVVELRLQRSELGLAANEQPFALTVVTFDNGTGADPSALGFNNLTDTTVDYPGQDALDAMGGLPGVSANAYQRAFSSGTTLDPSASAPLDLQFLTGVAQWELLN